MGGIDLDPARVAEVKIWAEWRGGHLLRAIEPCKDGPRPDKLVHNGPVSINRESLVETGLFFLELL